MVLDAATKDGERTLDLLLDNLMNQLHSIVCQPVDFSNMSQIKNQNELLRCFTMLSRFYIDICMLCDEAESVLLWVVSSDD